MALGYRFATDADFEHALDGFLAGSQHEGLHDNPSLHSAPGGWFSVEVIAHAITAVSMRKAGKVEYVMQLQPLYVEPARLHSCVGAIVNVDDAHWVCLKAVSGDVWLLDSQQKPKQLTEAEYHAFLRLRKAAYPIYWAEDMGTSGASLGTSAHSGETVESPLLPLASQDVIIDSPATLESYNPASIFAGESNVPSLMIAETFGAGEAMELIQDHHMQRGLELEAMALDARSEYESALAERGGH